MEPADSVASIGEVITFRSWERDANCYGMPGPEFYTSGTWTTDNPLVLDIGTGTVLEAGEAAVFCQWDIYSYQMTTEDIQPVCETHSDITTASSTVNAPDPNRKIISITQQIIDESSQGGEVVECGRFKIIVKYAVGCPQPNHALTLIGHISEDATLESSTEQPINTGDLELCTYEITNLYRMHNRLSQSTGTGFTTYTAKLTWSGTSVTRAGPGISTRATISGVGSCP